VKAYTEQSERQRHQTLERVAEARSRQLDADLRELMRHPHGRRVMHWVIHELCLLQSVTFNERVHDGLCADIQHHRMDGRRIAGIELFQKLRDVDMAMVAAMNREHDDSVLRDLGLNEPQEEDEQ
jgi:hypothetical protein